MSLLVTGLLIQAVTGILGALGRRVKRRGFAAQAAFSTAWRLSWIAGVVSGSSALPQRAFALAGCAWDRGSACWFAQVRRLCGQCLWLSVRWAA
jgi:hypothetical protein